MTDNYIKQAQQAVLETAPAVAAQPDVGLCPGQPVAPMPISAGNRLPPPAAPAAGLPGQPLQNAPRYAQAAVPKTANQLSAAGAPKAFAAPQILESAAQPGRMPHARIKTAPRAPVYGTVPPQAPDAQPKVAETPAPASKYSTTAVISWVKTNKLQAALIAAILLYAAYRMYTFYKMRLAQKNAKNAALPQNQPFSAAGSSLPSHRQRTVRRSADELDADIDTEQNDDDDDESNDMDDVYTADDRVTAGRNNTSSKDDMFLPLSDQQNASR